MKKSKILFFVFCFSFSFCAIGDSCKSAFNSSSSSSHQTLGQKLIKDWLLDSRKLLAFEKIQIEDFSVLLKEELKKYEMTFNELLSNKAKPNFKNLIKPLEVESLNIKRLLDLFYISLDVLSPNLKLRSQMETEIGPAIEKLNTMYASPKLTQKLKKVDTHFSSSANPEVKLVIKEYLKDLRDSQSQRLKRVEVTNALLRLTRDYDKIHREVQERNHSYIKEKIKTQKLSQRDLKILQDYIQDKKSLSNLISKMSSVPFKQELLMHFLNGLKKENIESVMFNILKKRHELAKVYKSKNYLNFILKKETAVPIRMLGSSKKIHSFLHQVSDVLMPIFKKDTQDVQNFINQKDGTTKDILSEFWNIKYWAKKFFEQKFQIKEKELIDYMTLDNSLNAILKIGEKLYGFRFEKETVNYKQVMSYKVFDESHRLIGRIYIDVLSRKGRSLNATAYSGQFSLRSPKKDPKHNISNVIVAANINPKKKDGEHLISFLDLEIIFHEFGHAFDMIAKTGKYQTSNDVQWSTDATEIPSMLMERFLPYFFKNYAKHYKTGKTPPKDLVNKHLAFDSKYKMFGFMFSLLVTAKIDIHLHEMKLDKKSKIEDFLLLENKILSDFGISKGKDYELSRAFLGSFLPSKYYMNGYETNFYSYLVGEVYSYAIFSQLLSSDGTINREMGLRFKNKFLNNPNPESTKSERYLEFSGGQSPDIKGILKNI